MKPSKVTRPLLRYYGGKWRIAQQIVAMMPRHDVYTEAFGGGGSVLLRKPESLTEVWNDLNSDVVNVFRQMRNSGPELSRLLSLTPFSREEMMLAYEPTVDLLEAARRFIFRASAGFGSDAAFRQNGFRISLCDQKHNTAKSWAGMEPVWKTITERLRRVVLEHRPAVEVIQSFDTPATLHYVDPPYVMSERKQKGKTYPYEMTDKDHASLSGVLREVKGMVILSGYDSPLYKKLYKGWRMASVDARDGNNNARAECLWFSPSVPDPEPDLFPCS